MKMRDWDWPFVLQIGGYVLMVLGVIVAMVMLGGCYFQPEDYSPGAVEIPNVGSDPFNVLFFVARTITYKDDPAGRWQGPEETYARRTGDCEDYATLAMFLLERDTDAEVLLAVGYSHAWLIIDGESWETIGFYKMSDPPPIRYTMNWRQVETMIDS